MVMDQRLPAYVQVSDLDEFSYYSENKIDNLCDYSQNNIDDLCDLPESLRFLNPDLGALDQLILKTAGYSEVAIGAPGLSLATPPDSEHGGISAKLAYCGFANDVPMMVQCQQLGGNEQQVQCRRNGRGKVAAGESLKKMTDKASSGGRPESRNDASMEATLRPFLQAAVGHSHGPTNWWKNNHKTAPLLCPLTGFPICLLPYPPFKLHMKGSPCSSRHFVDGKFLALRGIATGCFVACGVELDAYHISKLDAHISRCKLGKCRPSHAVALAQEASRGATAAERDTASAELGRFVTQARDELRKLQNIQQKRLLQINQILPPDLQAILKCLQKSQRETDDIWKFNK